MEKQYSLLNTDGVENWTELVAHKVRGLLDDTGPSNMVFTDGPSDHNVNRSVFLHMTFFNLDSTGKPRTMEPPLLPGNYIQVPFREFKFSWVEIHCEVWPTTYCGSCCIRSHHGEFYFVNSLTHYLSHSLHLGLYLSGRMGNRNTDQQGFKRSR